MPEIARYQRKLLARRDAMDLRDLVNRVLIVLEQEGPVGLEQEGQQAAAKAADLSRQLTAISDLEEVLARISRPGGLRVVDGL